MCWPNSLNFWFSRTPAFLPLFKVCIPQYRWLGRGGLGKKGRELSFFHMHLSCHLVPELILVSTPFILLLALGSQSSTALSDIKWRGRAHCSMLFFLYNFDLCSSKFNHGHYCAEMYLFFLFGLQLNFTPKLPFLHNYKFIILESIYFH